MSIISEWATRALAISVALTLTACGAQPSGIDDPTATHSMAGMDHGTMPMNNADVPYDAQFIDSMIVHHQGAIEMAKQVQQEAQKPELQTLAQNIITAQQAEIAQLQQWRKEWYPDLPITAGMGMDMGDMTISADTSIPFEQRFIEAMVRHHEGAVAMAKDAEQHTERSEIKTLAQNIITTQEAEIKQMEQWQTEWYGE